MLAKEEIASLKDVIRKKLDESLDVSWCSMTWGDCLTVIYNTLFPRVSTTTSRLMPKLDTYTSLFGEFFGEGAFSIEGNTATVTTPYDKFVFEDKGKGNVRLTSTARSGFFKSATFFEPRDLVGFIADGVTAALAVEPVWKEYEPRFQERDKVQKIEDRYYSIFLELMQKHSSALLEGEPVTEIEEELGKAEAAMREELGTGADYLSIVEGVKRDAEKQIEMWRKSEERSRRASEAYRKKKEEREARHEQYANDLEARLGVRPAIAHRVPMSGGSHYDTVTYPLPNGQNVTFRYYDDIFEHMLKDAEAMLQPLRILSELSSTKLKVKEDDISGIKYRDSTPAMLRYWTEKAEEDLADRPALKEMVGRFRGMKLSFHVKPALVETRFYFRKGQKGYLSASVQKKASDETVAAFSDAVAALVTADDSRRKGRGLMYSFD